jgi:hypothetical protein
VLNTGSSSTRSLRLLSLMNLGKFWTSDSHGLK